MTHDTVPRQTATWTAVAVLLAVHVALVVSVAAELPATADEWLYIKTGRLSLAGHDWANAHTRYQGPFGLYFNQLFLGGEPDGVFVGDLLPRLLLPARLGMLPFALLGAGLVFAWARALFGARAGLLALALYALNPLIVGYSALVNVDLAHASLTLLTLFLLWRHASSPTLARLCAVGVALGLALGTKYLALPLAPCVLVLVGWHRWRGADGAPGMRAAAVIVHALALVAVVTVALHATYRFRAGLAPLGPDGYTSAALRGIAGVPVLAQALAALPRPYAEGADALLRIDARDGLTYLRGSFEARQPTYFAWSLALKLPELLLATVALGGGALLARGMRGGLERPERDALLVVLAGVGVPFVTLSLGMRYLVGVRYVLQYVPPLLVLGGATWLTVRDRLPAPGRRVAVVAGLLVLAYDAVADWPNSIAYYNTLAGRADGGYRHFRDSNSEWGQLKARGLEQLRRTHGDEFVELGGLDGPRFGPVALYLRDLLPASRVPGPPAHWALPFEPVASVGSAWFLFDVRPADYEALLAREDDGADRWRIDYARALLRDERRAEAERVLASATGPRAELLRGVLAEVERLDAGDPVPRRVLPLAREALSVGFAEVTERLLVHPALSPTAGSAFVLAEALLVQRKFEESARILVEHGAIEEMPGNALLLANVCLHRGRLAEARALLERLEDRIPTELAKRHAELRAELESREALRAPFRDR
jgi:hypothetical protein